MLQYTIHWGEVMADTFNMSDVMISYSRRDKTFAQQLETQLRQSGREIWIDWEDIAPTADWWDEIRAGIEAAHTIVFILSPNSVRSEVCWREVQHAADHNKRIVPVVLEMVTDPKDRARIHPALAAANWILFTDPNNHDKAFDTLIRALETDLSYTRFHTRLLVRAREWDAQNRSTSFMLRGEDLKLAEKWLDTATGMEPAPTTLQRDYILESRKAARRARRAVTGGTAFAVTLIVVAAIFAIIQGNEASRSLEEANVQRTQAAQEANGARTAIAIQITAQANAAQANAEATVAADNANAISTNAQIAADNQETALAAAATSDANATLSAITNQTEVAAADAAANAADAAAADAANRRATAEAQVQIANVQLEEAEQLRADAEQQVLEAQTQATEAAVQLDVVQLTATAISTLASGLERENIQAQERLTTALQEAEDALEEANRAEGDKIAALIEAVKIAEVTSTNAQAEYNNIQSSIAQINNQIGSNTSRINGAQTQLVNRLDILYTSANSGAILLRDNELTGTIIGQSEWTSVKSWIDNRERILENSIQIAAYMTDVSTDFFQNFDQNYTARMASHANRIRSLQSNVLSSIQTVGVRTELGNILNTQPRRQQVRLNPLTSPQR